MPVPILEGKLPIKVLARWHNKEIDGSDKESTNVSVINDGSSKSIYQRFDSLFKFLLRERKNAENMLLLKNYGNKTQVNLKVAVKTLMGILVVVKKVLEKVVVAAEVEKAVVVV